MAAEQFSTETQQQKDCRMHQPKKLERSEDSMGSRSSDSESMSDANSCYSDGNPATSGRFSEEEKKTLFTMIKSDRDLLRAFLHQLTKRKWDGKSWMNEIAKRFNTISKNKRKHDAVRHHLKLRKSRNNQEDDNETLISLLRHTIECPSKDTCSKCFQLQRLRVKLKLACCGFAGCQYCDESKPDVLADFDAKVLLREVQQELQNPVQPRSSPSFTSLSMPSPQSPFTLSGMSSSTSSSRASSPIALPFQVAENVLTTVSSNSSSLFGQHSSQPSILDMLLRTTATTLPAGFGSGLFQLDQDMNAARSSSLGFQPARVFPSFNELLGKRDRDESGNPFGGHSDKRNRFN